ncbi:MAG: chemotaxis protein CheB, partial [Symploca sp. SIO2D2]|nr:chemotaxis protein CheB [Symploca sp. SIO2D2]
MNPTSESSLTSEKELSNKPSHIVGIGASAGGLEALVHFFSVMPLNSGYAFVVVQHLSPDFKSVMDELLSRHTDMPIHLVEDRVEIEKNSVYLIPPKKEMVLLDGRLLLTDKDPTKSLSLPIDVFFRSLAQDMGDKAIAVVLSGTGSDGSRGIVDVHDAGGMVIAQSDETAKFNGMPRSATDTGMVDYVLGPEEIPQAVLK